MELTRCRFNRHDLAVVLVALSDGCFCFEEDREQALCLHHFHKASPRGTMRVIYDFTMPRPEHMW